MKLCQKCGKRLKYQGPYHWRSKIGLYGCSECGCLWALPRFFQERVLGAGKRSFARLLLWLLEDVFESTKRA